MSYNILIVENDKNCSKLIEENLIRSSFDFHITFVEQVQKTFEWAFKIKPDLILLGIGEINSMALDIVSMLHHHECTLKIPVLILTPCQTPELLNEISNAGAFDIILNPPSGSEFNTRISNALELIDSYRQIDLKIDKAKKEVEALEKIMTITSSSPFAFIVVNPSGELEWANDGFERMHGYTLDEYLKNPAKTIFSLFPNSEISDVFNKSLTDKQSTDCICKNVSKSGDEQWIQIFITPQLNSSGLVDKFIVVEIDISIFIKKEEELNAQFRRMKEITFHLEKANSQLEVQKGEINQQKLMLELEQEKSEKLLLNILPFEVAKQLKSKGRTGSRQYKLVSVLFADFKGFSRISKTLDPKDLVSILDSYFAKFDEIIGLHYIEKIKTIGDAYMCAGGLPLSNKSNPVDTVLAGLEIQHYMNTLNDSKVLSQLPVWELRLGIHSGPVVAGVVGKKRFAYDIWGDTVNIASRMEQSGHVGMVNVSGVTYEYIKEFFDCDYRGKIDTKNLGKIDMYFINRIKPEFSNDPLGIIPNEKMINLVNKL